MNKNILIVEPAFKTKYPPLGLMKLATYHKNIRKDKVTFIRGCKQTIFNEQWDRIYISTLFTYNWDITTKTINFYKNMGKGDFYDKVSYRNKIYIGGILATLLPKDLYNATGVNNIVQGLLFSPKQININDDLTNINELPPDYSILAEVESDTFKYSNKDDYLGYSTRGCKRKCKFCAVHQIEPKYVSYIDLKKMISQISKYNKTEKRNLILMDNNILASDDFNTIINDIKNIGFKKGSRFGDTKAKRTVDFNQGLDARFLTEEKMKKLSEIDINPMRIAFDDIKLKNIYEKAVRLAHKYGQINMSNYVLYNYKDTPEDFYERLKINIELNEEFKNTDVKTKIYSFPMRFIPLNSKNRNIDTGNKYWNKRYLRGVQLILNVTRGPVMPGSTFFYQAFGRNADEFKAILTMPDDFIRFRLIKNWKEIDNYEDQWQPYIKEWMNLYNSLNKNELKELINIIGGNNIENIKTKSRINNKKLKKIINMYINEKKIAEEYNNDK